MRYTATATDPQDFSRALRLELGLASEYDGTDAVIVAAVAGLDGTKMLELMALAKDEGQAIVVMKVSVPFKLHEPADVMVFEDLDGCVTMRTGYTLWAGTDPSTPLLLVGVNGGHGARTITPEGLASLSGVPVGIEGSTAPGILRASDRLTDRLLAIGQLKDVNVKAA